MIKYKKPYFVNKDMKKTKIICTIGPASMDKKTIIKMHKNGMNACRINMSHGDFKQYTKMIKNIRSVCNVPIILDTQGPEVRVVNKTKLFKKNEIVNIKLSVNIYSQLKKGKKILFNDGLDKATIVSIKKNSVDIKMNSNGKLINNRSVLIKNINIKLPILSKKDEQGIKFAVKNKLDFVAVSFANSAKNINLVKKKLGKSGIQIIAKIENALGVKKFDEILNASDAIMVARGDLGTEIPSEKIPLLQKEMIEKSNIEGKPVIVATQMMESMINNRTPTRAETSDVANAILDGADSVMLSAETSIGKHPALVVKTMTKICKNTEKSPHMPSYETINISVEDAITNNAFQIADNLGAKIICLTRSGYTARMICRFKPDDEIIAITPNEKVARQLMISYAVNAIIFKELKEEEKIKTTTKFCVKKKLINKNDLILFVAGLFVKKTTNTIIVYRAKEII